MTSGGRETPVYSQFEIEALRNLAVKQFPVDSEYDPDLSPEDRKKAREEESKAFRDFQEKIFGDMRNALDERLSKAYKDGADDAVARAEQSAWNARSVALYLLILAVVLMPGIAMVIRMTPQDFGSYIAPITGITGTVVGYWFSTSSRSGGGPRVG